MEKARQRRIKKKFNKHRDWSYFLSLSPIYFVEVFLFPRPLLSTAELLFFLFCSRPAYHHRPPNGVATAASAASTASATAAAATMADDTSGIRHTRKRQNYTLNIYDKPNPLSTLKTHQPFLSVYTIKTRSRDKTRRWQRWFVVYIRVYAKAIAAAVYDFRCPK